MNAQHRLGSSHGFRPFAPLGISWSIDYTSNLMDARVFSLTIGSSWGSSPQVTHRTDFAVSTLTLLETIIFVARVKQHRNIRIRRRPTRQKLLVGLKAAGLITRNGPGPG